MLTEFTDLLVSDALIYFKKSIKVKENLVRKNLLNISNRIIDDEKMFDLKLSNYERERNLKEYFNINFEAVEEIPLNKFVEVKS